MGLEIFYDIHAPASWEDASVVAAIESARRRALTLDFTQVGEVEANDPSRPETIGVRRPPKDFPHLSLQASAEAGWLFRTWPGDRCETARFGLYRFPARVPFDGGSVALGWGNGWHYHTWCKTQYADLVSREHFLKCHLGVIAVLDHFRENGCRVNVRDGGGYWKSRSLKLLARRLEEMHAIVAAFTGAFKDTMQHPSGQLVAPITQHAQFEHLEAKGRAAMLRKRRRRKSAR